MSIAQIKMKILNEMYLFANERRFILTTRMTFIAAVVKLGITQNTAALRIRDASAIAPDFFS